MKTSKLLIPLCFAGCLLGQGIYGGGGSGGGGTTSPSASWAKYSVLPGNSNFSIVAIASTLAAITDLNDIEAGAGYSSASSHTYLVQIDATGAPDTFKWQLDGGAFTSGVSITGSAQTLSNGFAVIFAATTGHTLADKWQFAIGTPTAQAGATAQDLTVVTPPAKNVVEAVVMSQPSTWSGTSVTNLTASLGRTGTETDFSQAVCIISGTCGTAIGAATPLYSDGGAQIYNTASQAIVVRLTSVGANLSALTAGVLDIWLKTSVLP